jgi:hypothetical protein
LWTDINFRIRESQNFPAIHQATFPKKWNRVFDGRLVLAATVAFLPASARANARI